MRFARVLACAALACAACGGRSQGRQPDGALSLVPAAAALHPGDTRKFSASRPVAWSIAEGPSGGSIAADGTYTAPPLAGVFHVVASAGGVSASAPVTVTEIGISVSPAAADLAPGGSLRLRASVSGDADASVLWSVREGDGGGSVDANGVYTAPQQAGLYHVVAASHADPSHTASAAVSVAPRPVVTVSIDPPAAALEPGRSAHFAAAVTGAADTSVSWSVAEPDGGAVADDGTYSAPRNPGTFHVTATSRADPLKRASAQITVAPGVTVTITPRRATVQPGARQQFTAAASGADTRVTWSVAEGAAAGSVDASGLFIASGSAGAAHVIATSVADPRSAAAAEVTVPAAPVQVVVSPVAATLRPGALLQLAASVTGSADARVEWSGDCCVTPDGAFTAPATEGVVHLTAHSLAAPAQAATVTITVRAQPGAVAIDPAEVTLHAGDRLAFTAQAHAEVAWSVQEGSAAGGISGAGVYQAPPDRGGTFHVVAAARDGAQATATVTVLPPDLIDHGGAVVAATRTFAVFWGDLAAWPADVPPAQEALLRALDGSAYLALADQYLRGQRASTLFGGAVYDPSPPPDSAGQADNGTVGAVACNALHSAAVAPAAGDVVIVYSSAALSPAPAWCAWHSSYTCDGVTLLIAFVPNVAGSWACLNLGAPHGCNAASADANATATLTAHELLEAMTDPAMTAWTDAAGLEIGDKCEDQARCVQLGSSTFQLQAEYSNAAHACAP